MQPSSAATVAVLDANVLYGQFARDVLLRLATGRLYQPRWTDRIQDEWTRNLIADRPDLSPIRVHRARALMEQSFPAARVTEYEALEEAVADVHPGDRHVVAAAVRTNADCIVTRNLKHFPAEALRRVGIKPVDPDDFIAQILKANGRNALTVLDRHRRGLRNPSLTPGEYRAAFVRSGLPRSAEHLPGGATQGRTIVG